MSDHFDRHVKKSKILLSGREEEKKSQRLHPILRQFCIIIFSSFLFPALILQKFNIFLKKHFRGVGYIG